MKKNVFLLELILAILMFAIASAVCLRVFVNSRLVSEEATNINEAVLVTSNIEEAFSSAGSVKDAQKLLSRVYPSNLQVSDEGGCIVLSDELEAVYRIGEGKNGTTAITVEVYEIGKRASASSSRKVVYSVVLEVFYAR